MRLQIRKGANRIVFIFPFIVIKIPFIKPSIGWRLLLFNLKRDSIPRIEKFDFELGKYTGKSFFRDFLMEGVVNNWREYRFYWETRHPFLQPTYFSLAGLLNIQRHGPPCDIPTDDFNAQLYELTGGEVMKDSHHFENQNNFSLEKGRLRIIDYGNPKTQEIVALVGNKIMERFDPKYKWKG